MSPFGQTPGSSPLPIRPVVGSGGRSALLTYEPYYGLKEKPFSLSADPRFLYKSRTHSPVFDDLLAGIRRREGLIVLTGDIGTGKTTLCRSVLNSLDHKTFSAFVPDPFVSREDLLKTLLIDFGVMSVDDLKSGRLAGASRADLSYPLYEFLNSLVPLQAFAVLIIDEAQNLPVPLLEEIRILSDLEAPEKLLQVVLVGQLELQQKIKLQEMRQLDQRVSVRCRLEALNREGVAGYVSHRLSVAGGTPDRVAFAQGAIDVVYRASNGVPRVINLLCDRALHHGYMLRSPMITVDMVRSAAADLELSFDATETIIYAPEPIAPASETVAAEPVHTPPPALTEPPLFIDNDPEAAKLEEIRDIDFNEQDLRDAPAAVLTPTEDLAEPEPAELIEEKPASDGSGHLLFESRAGRWSAPAARRPRRGRRSTRRLLVAAAIIAGVATGLVTASYLQDEMENPPEIELPAVAPPPIDRMALEYQPKSRAAEVPLAAPAVPPAPADGGTAAIASQTGFAVDVALFRTQERARQALDSLAAEGFQAFVLDRDLGTQGVLHEVLVGTFPTREQAETEMEKIRSIAGYPDARVTSVP